MGFQGVFVDFQGWIQEYVLEGPYPLISPLFQSLPLFSIPFLPLLFHPLSYPLTVGSPLNQLRGLWKRCSL